MKPASSALVSYLNAVRSNRDAPLLMADCFTFTLQNGSVLSYTNIDVSFSYGGVDYLANSILVDGLKYKAAIGLEVDQQQMTVSARQSDAVVSGAPFLEALRSGAFDGCEIERDRVFFSDVLGGSAIGSVLLFKGRLGTVDQIGRTTAKLTVNSDLALLDIDMPRNLWQATCVHTLYDSGCTLAKNAFGTSGSVGSGSTASAINWGGASLNHQQGTITFTSGANAGVTAAVVSASAGSSLTLGYPLETPPAEGDGFTAYFGCDHTQQTCQARFNNVANFRGFPYVPPPELSI